MAVKDDYVRLVKELLPPGPAWPRDDTTSPYALMIDEIAEACAQLDRQVSQLVEESDPYTCAQSFEDWETEWGLPDPCILKYGDDAQSIEQRRAHIIFKSSLRAGQSRNFFIELAAFFDRKISIEELRDEIHPELNHTWRVTVYESEGISDDGRLVNLGGAESIVDDGVLGATGQQFFEDNGYIGAQGEMKYDMATVMMQANDPLAYWGDQLIECVINKYRPAHTTVLFAYV